MPPALPFLVVGIWELRYDAVTTGWQQPGPTASHNYYPGHNGPDPLYLFECGAPKYVPFLLSSIVTSSLDFISLQSFPKESF